MTSKHSVSILILIRGQSDYLGECIRALGSIESDNFDPTAIFINDGASSEDYSIFKKYIDCIPYNYEYYEWEQKGIENSLNTILDRINTQFFVRCDGDDILHSNYFTVVENKMKFFENKSDICGIAPSFKIIEEDARDILYTYQDKYITERFLESAGDILATGMLISVDKIKKAGLYQTDIVNSGLESYELCLRLLSHNYRILTINSSIFSYRRHNKSASQTRESDITKNGHIINEKYMLGKYKRGLHHPYLIS